MTYATYLLTPALSYWHDVRARRLEALQTESKRLQIDHSTKLRQVQDVLSRLEARIQETRMHPEVQPLEPGDAAFLEKHMASLSLSESILEKEQALLKSLTFQHRPVRHAAISEAHEKTFRWALHADANATDVSKYLANWLEAGSGRFWISGKPGSGKSTFMKYIASEPKTAALLASWARPRKAVIASHYFWSSGTSMQMSQQGLMQNLLYEIFRQCPGIMKYTTGERWTAHDTHQLATEPWTLPELSQTVRSLAKQHYHLDADLKFCFFIDGLDEYEGDHIELCQTLQDIAQSPHIKLCVSSRPWNVFKEMLGDESTKQLHMHNLTRNDIRLYAEARLYDHPRWKRMTHDDDQIRRLIEEITERACGVFLWVFLVTRQLREGITNRDSVSDLQRRLEGFPAELDAFFKQILNSVDPFYHCKLSTTLQIATVTKQPLNIILYYFHDLEHDDEDYVEHIPAIPFLAGKITEISEETRWRLDSRCRGLLEVDPQYNTVDFLHRTVSDFLRTREMIEFLDSKSPSGFDANLSLLKAHVAWIKRSGSHANKVWLQRLDFGHYQGCNEADVARSRLQRHDPPAYSDFAAQDAMQLRIQRLVGSAFRYAADMDTVPGPARPRSYRVLDELRSSLLKMQKLKVFATSSPVLDDRDEAHDADAFFREHAMAAQIVGYLDYRLCKSVQDFGPRLLEGITMSFNRTSGSPLRDRGTEILRHMLETHGVGLSQQSYGSQATPWTHVMSHISEWKRASRPRLQQMIATVLESGILSLLLEHGADPNAVVWDATLGQPCPAWTVYALLAFEVWPEKETESRYLRVLNDFLRAGAAISPETEGRDEEGAETVPIYESFFGHLKRLTALHYQLSNASFVAEVANTLLTLAEDSNADWPMDMVSEVCSHAFQKTAACSSALMRRFNGNSGATKLSAGIQSPPRGP